MEDRPSLLGRAESRFSSLKRGEATSEMMDREGEVVSVSPRRPATKRSTAENGGGAQGHGPSGRVLRGGVIAGPDTSVGLRIFAPATHPSKRIDARLSPNASSARRALRASSCRGQGGQEDELSSSQSARGTEHNDAASNGRVLRRIQRGLRGDTSGDGHGGALASEQSHFEAAARVLHTKSDHSQQEHQQQQQQQMPRSKWQEDEDERLRAAVTRNGSKNWKQIAKEVGSNRSDVQCLHRWDKVLKPGLHKGLWTPEEDERLLRYMQ
ncbi:unnamed protein product, partial [Phaeothamnion confervicola]